jgi:rRNA maturation RNase YbeY
MISIRNSQRSIPLDVKKLEKDAQKILGILGYEDFDLGIWITTNQTIRKYNKEYRHKDKATDILSFPFYPELKAGQKINAETADQKNLGDIIISAAYLEKDAAKYGVSFYERLQRILVHGICHLLGYDHIEDKDFEVMIKKERELLSALQKNPKL